MLNHTSELNEATINHAVRSALPEGLQLEYKENLPGNSHEEKKEFLADVSAMANTSGGLILYGVAEQRDANGKPTGVPNPAFTGVAIENGDAVIQRLENLLRDSIAPRMHGISIHPIPMSNGNFMLAIRISRSANGPHVVDINGHWRFYGRDTKSKYQMDVEQVRAAFVRTSDKKLQLQSFLDTRWNNLRAGKPAVPLLGHAQVVLHLCPLTYGEQATEINIEAFMRDERLRNLLRPIYCDGHSQRVVGQGVVSTASYSGDTWGYAMLTREGAIEAVDAGLLDLQTYNGNQRLYLSTAIEDSLVKAATNYSTLLREVGHSGPKMVSLALLGVNGNILQGPRLPLHKRAMLTQDEIFVPPVVIEDSTLPAADMLRPMFDKIWNYFGFPGSRNFDEQGKWTGGL